MRPENGASWYIQTEHLSINSAREWTAKAWIGNREFSPKEGEKFDIAAVVTEPFRVQGKKTVSDLKELEPKAKSEVNQVMVSRFLKRISNVAYA